ncbi:MAG TPA: MerR family DNA-binding protein [Pseudonocardiaceae bacterium]|jgi:MerR family mercuric resistance operon transcriptional regulator|nr:MerR family DNA-binding protein [Pseudonocardiaceae bacterium]
MPSETGRLTITHLATRVGVRPDTLRYYERIGLLPPADRTPGAHRRYDASVVDRMLFIKGVQRLGLPLAEIRELLAVRDTGLCACAPAELLLRQHVAELDEEMRRLAALRAELTGMLAGMTSTSCVDPEPGSWCPPAETRKEASRMTVDCDCCTDCENCECCS